MDNANSSGVVLLYNTFMENEKERLKLLEALIEEGKEFELEPLSFERYKFCKVKEDAILTNGLQEQQNGEYVVFIFDDSYGEKLLLGYSTKCGKKSVRT